MRRCDFIVGMASSSLAWPLALRAQQSDKPVIGFIGLAPFAPMQDYLAGFRLGLKGEGFVEGENVVVEYRSAENQLDRLPAIAAEVVRQRVAVIVTVGGDPSIVAAKSATTAIPIIFNTGTDPVRAGHVASMNSPGGNATGVNLFTGELGPKRLSLLSDLLPTASHLAILFNPNVPLGVINADQAETAARNLGKQVKKYTASSNEEIDAAFADAIESLH